METNLIAVLGADGVDGAAARFDYGQLSDNAARVAQQAGSDLDSLQGSFLNTMNQVRDRAGEILANVREVMDKEQKGLFFQWAEQERGLKRGTVLNLLNYHKVICQNFDSREKLLSLPASLVYALGKDSTPDDVKQGILSGAITNVKDMEQASADPLAGVDEETRRYLGECKRKLERIHQKRIVDLCRSYEDLENALRQIQEYQKQNGRYVPTKREIIKAKQDFCKEHGRTASMTVGEYDFLEAVYDKIEAGENVTIRMYNELQKRLYPDYWKDLTQHIASMSWEELQEIVNHES